MCVCLLCVCCHVGGCVGVRGMQVNSLRRPTAPRASLAHHLTAMPDEGLRTNELVRQMSGQTREGWRGGGWTRLRRAAAVAHGFWFHDLHTSAISGPHRSASLSFPFLLLSVTELSAFTTKFNISPPIPLLHLRSCNPIVLLGWSGLFLNCPEDYLHDDLTGCQHSQTMDCQQSLSKYGVN